MIRAPKRTIPPAHKDGGESRGNPFAILLRPASALLGSELALVEVALFFRLAAHRLGHDVVMTPHQRTCLTVYQTDPDVFEQPPAVAEVLTTADVYAYRPVPAGLDGAAAQRVLGAQGCLWTQYMATPEHVLYMAFPRLCALAEVLRGTADAYPEFEPRLRHHLRRLDRLGVTHGGATL